MVYDMAHDIKKGGLLQVSGLNVTCFTKPVFRHQTEEDFRMWLKKAIRDKIEK